MKIVGVTSCPTGIAHTYMAAEALEMAAKELGYEIKIETQGSVGAENVLTDEEIEEADAVIIAASTKVATDRFVGKRLLDVGVQEAIKDAKGLIKQALKAEKVSTVDNVSELKLERKEQRSGPYKHLLTGVSYMIPFVVAGGISIAISFLWGYKAFDPTDSSHNIWAEAFMTIGGGSGAFGLIVPILAGYMAYSIADRPGLVPGMVGGMVANVIGARGN
jgi:PTS system fructose-specific IIC component